MKQIVDKLNKIAKKINENVELSDRDLIIDSLDSITKAYGGTPNDSNLIVDKLEDIYNNIGAAPSGNIEITENTTEPLDIAQYATATVNVSGGGGDWTTANIILRQTIYTEDYDPATTCKTSVPVLYNENYEPINVPFEDTLSVQIPLYKGATEITINSISWVAWSANNFDISGSITYDDDAGTFIITGDCTIGLGIEK